jgi:hypothetical protein
MSTAGREHKEPLIRISKRTGISHGKAWGIRGIALLLSLVVSGFVIFAIVKLSPIKVYAAMFDGAFSTPKRSWATIRDSVMMLCIAVGLAPAFKMKFWNIGAEGQILVGGIVTAGLHEVSGAHHAHRPAVPGDDRRQPHRRRRLGRHPRHLQGPLEHQRDPFHPDDELRGHPAHQLLRGQVGEPSGLQLRGHHQPDDQGRLDAQHRSASSTCSTSSSCWR